MAVSRAAVQSWEDRDAPGVPRQRKLADRVAARIVADVIDAGWPSGEILGSEKDLLERYGVSRAVFREAVRLVEHKQVARMRRGPGGGLQVTDPDVSAVLDAVSVYVSYAGVTLAEVFEVRRVIEIAATELAATQLAEDDLRALRATTSADGSSRPQDQHRLHLEIGALTRNAAVELFCAILVRITALYVGSLDLSESGSRRARADSDDAHAAIVGALLDGNAGLAGHRMGVHLDTLEAYLADRRASQSILPEMLGRPATAGDKMAESVARDVFREVSKRGWPVGEVLGSEAELIERYGVSRAVIREAVRLLEHHQVAEMRRGPGGGLVVARPGSEAIAEALTLHLEHKSVRPPDLFAIRVALELAAIDLTAARLDDEGRAALRACVEAERAAGASANLNISAHDVHRLLAELTGNRLLMLFLRILISATARRTFGNSADDVGQIAAEVQRSHAGIVDAVLAGDAALARHRMRRHLDALGAWIETRYRSRPDR